MPVTGIADVEIQVYISEIRKVPVLAYPPPIPWQIHEKQDAEEGEKQQQLSKKCIHNQGRKAWTSLPPPRQAEKSTLLNTTAIVLNLCHTNPHNWDNSFLETTL